MIRVMSSYDNMYYVHVHMIISMTLNYFVYKLTYYKKIFFIFNRTITLFDLI